MEKICGDGTGSVGAGEDLDDVGDGAADVAVQGKDDAGGDKAEGKDSKRD
jgi:hypothetical protein